MNAEHALKVILRVHAAEDSFIFVDVNEGRQDNKALINMAINFAKALITDNSFVKNALCSIIL